MARKARKYGSRISTRIESSGAGKAEGLQGLLPFFLLGKAFLFLCGIGDPNGALEYSASSRGRTIPLIHQDDAADRGDANTPEEETQDIRNKNKPPEKTPGQSEPRVKGR